jgi:phage-related minor tail protein
MAKRRTIGENPLDTVVSTPEAALAGKTAKTPAASVANLERLAEALERLTALEGEIRDLRGALDKLKGEMEDLRRQAAARCTCENSMNWLREKVRQINRWPGCCQ